ncbi:MAG: hypothetical protein ACRD6W_12805 [Nitrososphaerales archaeon]
MVDAGHRPGVKGYEPDEPTRARRRINDLEAEFELVKTASAPYSTAKR